MSASFFLSACMNYGLALYFLKGTEHSREAYNEAIGKLTGWGFAVIGIPCLIIWIIAGWLLIRRLKALTDLDTEELMIPR